jgi:hypothetical protein
MAETRSKRGTKRAANKRLIKAVKEKYRRLRTQAESRISNYDTWAKWLEGDEAIMWDAGRPTWKPKVVANFIESIVRTKTAILTDSKPKFYIYGIPEVDMIDDMNKVTQMPEEEQSKLVENPSLFPEGVQKAEGLRRLASNMNIAVDDVFRRNDMHDLNNEVVHTAAATGVIVFRTFWNPTASGAGEISIETVHPRYVHFDENITKLDVKSGDCDWFIVGMPRTRAWADAMFPDYAGRFKPMKEFEDHSDYESQMVMYLEAYTTDPTLLKKTDINEDGTYAASLAECYGVTIVGDQVVQHGPCKVFPYTVVPYERNLETLINSCGDIKRLIKLQEDFNSKLCQVSINISLSANRQFVINPAQIGMRVEEFLEHAGEAGYAFITKKNVDDVKEAIRGLDTPAFNPELMQYLYLIPQYMEQVSGITKPIQGLAGKRERETKYQVQKQFEAGTIRIRSAARNFEIALTRVCKIVIELIKLYYDDERAIIQVDDVKQTMRMSTFSYPRDEKTNKPLDYEYIVAIQPDSMLPIDWQSQAERDMQLFQMKAIDPQTLLETLNHPRAQAVIGRLQQMNQQAQPQPAPAGPPGG